MIGISLLFLAIVWIALSAWTTKIITSRIKSKPIRFSVVLGLLAALLPLPLLDELVAKRQFEQACKAYTTVQLDHRTATGRTLVFDPRPNSEIDGSWVRIVSQPHRFVDPETGEVVLSYNTLIAEGGILSRLARISEGGSPLLFRGSCGPQEDIRGLIKRLDIEMQDRARINVREKNLER